jgi:hypothetical protein
MFKTTSIRIQKRVILLFKFTFTQDYLKKNIEIKTQILVT